MTRDDIIEMALESGFTDVEKDDVWITDGYWIKELERFASLVAEHEREDCARLVEADGLARGQYGYMLTKAAARIRARGEE